MSNICVNTINAEGSPSQMEEFIEKMSTKFEDDLHVDDDFATKETGYATLTLSSKNCMPESELKEVTASLSYTEGLKIRVSSEEPGDEYFAHATYSQGMWSFDSFIDINMQIVALTKQGVSLIKKHIEENGNIDFGEDCNWCALYVNDDGYAECPYFRRIELEDNKLTVLLSDGYWLYEDDLSTKHIMDIVSLLHDGKSPKSSKENNSDIWYCTECGSKDVEIKAWTYPNDGDKLAGNDSLDQGDCWCNDCQEHTELETCSAEKYPEILQEIQKQEE